MAITCATNKDTQICDRKKDYGTLSSDLTTDVEFLRFVPTVIVPRKTQDKAGRSV